MRGGGGRSALTHLGRAAHGWWDRLRTRPFGGRPGRDVTGDSAAVRAMAADVRLLVAALTAWATVAATLGLTPVARAGGAVGALAGAATMLVVVHRDGGGSTRTGGGRRSLRDLAGRVPLLRTGLGTSRRAGMRGRSVSGLAGLVLGVTGLTLAGSAAHGAVRLASPLDELSAQRATATVSGTVAADPVRIASTRPGGATVLVPLAVEHVRGRGAESAASATVLVAGDDRWAGVRWHEGVTVTGRLSPPNSSADKEVATMRPGGGPGVVRSPGAVVRGAERVRVGLSDAVSGQPPDARGLLPALVVGDTSRTPTDLTDAMRVTGMTHLSAVSGSNVAVVLVMVLWLCRQVGLAARWRPLVGLVGVAGFVVLARPEPSVLRAAVMGSVGLIGILTVRRAAGLPVLACAVVVLLLVDPWLARSYGFVLSTLATLGLLLFVRPWGDAIDRCLPERLSGLGQVLAIPAAAQLVCAPVIVLLQGSVSVVGVVANLLAAPFVGPATIAGVATALLGVVAPPAAQVVGWMGGVPTLVIARVARVGAAVPGGTAPWPDGAFGAVLLGLLTIGLVLTGRWWFALLLRRPRTAFAAGVLALSAAVPTRALTWPPPAWVVVACDVGQGDAIVLRTGASSAVLVDAGPDPPLVDRCLDALGVRRLDAIVLTHFHADHVDGLPGALDGRAVGQILVSPIADPQFQATEVSTWAGRRRIPIVPVWAGDELAFGTMTAHVWWPARRIASGSVPNNASVVMSVEDDGLRALMLGDVEHEAAHQVLLALRRGAGEDDPSAAHEASALSFDVVKVAHHGSANIDEGLYGGLSAPVALVSVGADNDYGHPAASTMDLLRRRGMAVWRTDLRGTVAVTHRGRVTAVTSTR